MQADKTIYWYDLETFGSDPRLDRACQFAGVRTDTELNIIDDPSVIYCRPSSDILPDPEACLITGITPDKAMAEGLSEAEFATKIHAEFSDAQTCVAGYNNIRFDDEITRRLFYRCLFDPYEREWKNGNSRWDIIDLVRMTYALRPEGINWPKREDGSPSFRLEALTAANNISHEDAHDALSDVYATIGMAKLIREKQPRLYQYYFDLRFKNNVLAMVNLAQPSPLVHVSSRYPASRACLAIVLPLIADPSNPNACIVYDLSQNPASWIDDSAEAIKERLFSRTEDLPEGLERVALKTLHYNRCPALAPLSVLSDEVLQRLDINMQLVNEHRERLVLDSALKQKLEEVFKPDFEQESDPDLMLYSGGFFDGHDRNQMNRVQKLNADELAEMQFDFHDKRLPELLFRYRCRNYPQTLSQEEQTRWIRHCREKLSSVSEDRLNITSLKQKIARLRASATQQQGVLLDDLNQYIERLCTELGITQP
ncbi:MAG: exodeoxyribonuclease I [Gammaproteobacteria bacterium]|nr:exodeoxyribonuclease I [Gammaproteobacteria bacterium]